MLIGAARSQIPTKHRLGWRTQGYACHQPPNSVATNIAFGTSRKVSDRSSDVRFDPLRRRRVRNSTPSKWSPSPCPSSGHDCIGAAVSI